MFLETTHYVCLSLESLLPIQIGNKPQTVPLNKFFRSYPETKCPYAYADSLSGMRKVNN